jgi:omega-6 fatty acid desaturase (delta-12 desaturase)
LRGAKIATDLALGAMLAALGWVVGWRELLHVALPVFWLASGFGVWLIWVQHRFEDALWQSSPDWDWETAALAGSSHFKLPRVLQFFSLNIGLHHVHHLNPRIPNYNLSRPTTRTSSSAPSPRCRSSMALERPGSASTTSSGDA